MNKGYWGRFFTGLATICLVAIALSFIFNVDLKETELYCAIGYFLSEIATIEERLK